ncbi:MAG: phosphogluconate dehydratase [Sphingomonadales bacterium]|nr:phosphogluconate dehydratase [Sphingomonadales bacterium]MDE2567383.1 phosphogluconate dehydratase [Sphingomonadales bacterium]
MNLHPVVARVTERIIARSKDGRAAYLALIDDAREAGVNRPALSCGNLAHGFAASGPDKAVLRKGKALNIGIVTAFNDVLSAHQPYGRYPEQIKVWAREVGATAQVAGGVPAMCDGVTQGQDSMELSLFSRDTIALSTVVALSHGMFEAALLLGICDKIVPGLLIGALRFGHLPTILVPAGPMPTGLPNKRKVEIRQLYAEGKVGREELLEAESESYHDAGTCTFYGTANSNQMMMEMMGLHMPGSSFVNPHDKLRQHLTRAAVHRAAAIGWEGGDYRPLGHCIDEKAIVNAIVGLLATGGSTNHFIHLPAIARAAGIRIDWDDMDELSRAVPLIASVYPNGAGDVNAFAEAGGMPYVIRELVGAGLAHGDIRTVYGASLMDGAMQPVLDGDALVWQPAPAQSLDERLLRPVSAPFQAEGGLRLLGGSAEGIALGRACIKVSAVARERWTIEAPCRVFDSQNAVLAAFKAGELERDVVVVVRFQGPAANGMPELHKLTPQLGVLQDRGFKVALVTDGRMSGASGKVPAAIHVSPEAKLGGSLAKLRDGDVVRVCAERGELVALVDEAEWAGREACPAPAETTGTGRELFALMRHHADPAERGGSAILAAAGL